MRKSFKYYLIIWVLCFALFNLFIFVIPSSIDGKTIIKVVTTISALKGDSNILTDTALSLSGLNQIVFNKYGGSFWVGYIIIIISFIGQIVCSYIAFKEKDNTKFFYNVTIIKSSFVGLIVTTIFGIMCIFVPDVSVWLGVVICSIVFVLCAISTIKAFAVSSIVSDKDEQIKEKTSFMMEMTAKAKVLYEQDKENKDLKRLYAAFRYADSTKTFSVEEKEKIRKEIDVALSTKNGNLEKTANNIILMIGKGE